MYTISVRRSCIYYTAPPGQLTGHPTIAAFTAVPTSIAAGGQSTLVWAVTNATTVSIDQGIGVVPATGTRIVSPASTVNYTMTASNPYGSVTATAVVTLNGQSAMGLPVISQFYANPNAIGVGGSTTLYWNVSNATSVLITNVGDVEASGSRTVYPEISATYTLIATNASGTSTSLVQVTVGSATSGSQGQGVPIVQEFRARPDVIRPGDSTVLYWQVDNASSVYIWGIGNVQPTGSMPISPYTTTGYVITASNQYGTSTSNTLVVVQ
ncbi:MAG: hypothetical protein WB588_00195 [Dehalococcoidia bacterium]